MKSSSLLAICLSGCLAVWAGCNDKNKAEEPVEKPDTVAAAPKPTEPAKAPEPAKPKAIEYSAETAAKLIGDMEKCEYDFNCKAYKPLVSFGKKVSADLAKFATDAAKPAKARAIAAKALITIKDPAVGKQMLEAARKEKDFMLRDKLYSAAAAGGSDEIFNDLTKLYLSKAGKEHQMQIRAGIRLYQKKALDWAIEKLPKTKKNQQVEVADIIVDLADKDSLKAIQGLIPKVKDIMARHRLASKAIALGDKGKFDILIKGLKSKDQYDRSDAANFLAGVIKQLPADKKAEVIKLLKAAKKKDRGGLTAMGYNKCLKALEGGAK
jgi:hypothetical protein